MILRTASGVFKRCSYAWRYLEKKTKETSSGITSCSKW